MAKSISEEELQLRKRARRRLIGAIAVVTIVAVFLPMALDHEPKSFNQDITIQIPPSGAGTTTVIPVPAPVAKPLATPASGAAPQPTVAAEGDVPKAAPAPPAKKPQGAVAAAPAVDSGAAAPKKPAVEQPKVAPKPAVKSVPAKTVDHAPPAAAGDGGYVVQIAALNDTGKAKLMQEQMAAAGIKSYTEVVPIAKGQVTRVRAGPFATRDEAEKIRDQLKSMGLSGNVVAK